jgi:hypothetical protein
MDKFKFAKDFKDFDKMNFFKDAIKERSKYPVISTCPICHENLFVTKLTCDHCGTSLDGKFALSKFNYLDSEKLYFIEVFVKNRGNIKAVEKEMDISYPTVKKLLDDAIIGLGYNAGDAAETPEEPEKPERPADPAKPEAPKLSKMQIIEKLQKKEISVAEATELLKK